MHSITPFLWFDNQAAEAAAFYQGIFDEKNGTQTPLHPNPTATAFKLGEHDFVALNGNQKHKFNESVSFLINCETQADVDYFWTKLSAGGEEQPCGWLKDKYGVSWQVIPTILTTYLQDPDRTKANNVIQAMFKMKKIEIQKLQNAYNG